MNKKKKGERERGREENGKEDGRRKAGRKNRWIRLPSIILLIVIIIQYNRGWQI